MQETEWAGGTQHNQRRERLIIPAGCAGDGQ